uniref:variable large family protein n=1 Tax=Borreliella garinii TaxID=29519 RepID=UPI001AED6155
ESAVGKTANALVGLVKAAGDVAKAVAGNDETKIGESVTTGGGGGGDAGAGDVEKAAAAVGVVSGEQILKAI